MSKKDSSAVEEYMARPDLPESLKAANREYLGAEDWVSALEAGDAAKAKPAADELQNWQAFAQAPWKPPAGLLEGASKLERDYPATLPLSLAVDLLAYGDEAEPDNLTGSGKLETGARRRQAFSALCRAAHQEKFPLEHGADCKPIKPGQFEFVQGMGREINSLEFGDAKEGAPDKHLKAVQIVSADKFYAWLRQFVGHSISGAKRGPKDKWDWTRGRSYALGEMEKRGDFADFQNQTEKWKSQTDLVVLVQAYLDEIGDNGEPGDTITKEKVRAWVDEYRARGGR